MKVLVLLIKFQQLLYKLRKIFGGFGTKSDADVFCTGWVNACSWH